MSKASAHDGTSSCAFSAFHLGGSKIATPPDRLPLSKRAPVEEKILVPGRYPATLSGAPSSHLVSCKQTGPVWRRRRHLRVLESRMGGPGVLQLLRFHVCKCFNLVGRSCCTDSLYSMKLRPAVRHSCWSIRRDRGLFMRMRSRSGVSLIVFTVAKRLTSKSDTCALSQHVCHNCYCLVFKQMHASKLMLKGGIYIYIPIQYGDKFRHPASKFPQFGLTKWVFRFIKQILSMPQHANPFHMNYLDLHKVKWKAQTNSHVSNHVSNAILASRNIQ